MEVHLVGYLTIAICVVLKNCFVDNLLKLNLLQVVTDHHLQDCEQFPVRNQTVLVDVINLG